MPELHFCLLLNIQCERVVFVCPMYDYVYNRACNTKLLIRCKITLFCIVKTHALL